jgi:hypothetical protein
VQAANTAADPARAVREGASALLALAAVDGAAIFLPTTGGISIWDALQRELNTRLELREIDEPLRRALQSLREEQRSADAPGALPQAALLGQRYAEQRIRICLNRAAPFWRLDDRAALEEPLLLERPIRLPLVGYDRDHYLAFLERAGVSEFLDRVVSTLGVTPKDRPGPYAVSVYVREGGIPLFYLDRALTGPMLRDATVVGRARPLVTDARSVREIVECDPPESDEARLGFALAAAVHFRVATLDAGGGVRFGLNGHGSPAYASVVAAWEVLGQEPSLVEEIVHQVRTCFVALSERERRQAIAAVAATAAVQAEAAVQAGDYPARIIWQRARTAAERRAERGHYHLA